MTPATSSDRASPSASTSMTPLFERTVFTLYDHVLTLDDKLRLYSAYTKTHAPPESAPPELNRMLVATPPLDAVRRKVWDQRRDAARRFATTAD